MRTIPGLCTALGMALAAASILKAADICAADPERVARFLVDMRAILKATDVCAREPARVAQLLVDKGYASRYDYALQAMQDLSYAKWCEYNPEDTVRFQALRLHEVGMIKTSPQKLVAQGTDWRFRNELKKELKA